MMHVKPLPLEMPWLLFCVGFTVATVAVFLGCFYAGVRAACVFAGCV